MMFVATDLRIDIVQDGVVYNHAVYYLPVAYSYCYRYGLGYKFITDEMFKKTYRV